MTRKRVWRCVWSLHSIALLSCAAEAPTASGMGPAGGIVRFFEGAVLLTFPSGALTANTYVSARLGTSYPASPLLLATTVTELSPVELVLAKPISLKMSFASVPLPEGVRSEELRIFRLVSGFWIQVGGTVNVQEGYVQFDALVSLGTFAIMAVPVQSVVVVPTALTLSVGGTGQLVHIARDVDGNTLPDRSISWSSAAPSIAAVNPSGLVSALSAGVAQISARSENGLPATVNATVTAPPASIYPPHMKN